MFLMVKPLLLMQWTYACCYDIFSEVLRGALCFLKFLSFLMCRHYVHRFECFSVVGSQTEALAII